MRELTEQTVINAPMEKVWEALADFGGVSDWAPYMKTSHLIGDLSTGIGTRRGMRHALGFRFEECVTSWEDGKGYSFDVFRAPFPMTDVKESWLAGSASDNSTVTTRVTYNMKLGPIGAVLDSLLVQFIVKREMRSGLRGLKQYIES